MADSPQSPVDEGNLAAPPSFDLTIGKRGWARLSSSSGSRSSSRIALATSGPGPDFRRPAFLAGALALTGLYVARSELGRGPAERLAVALVFLLIQAVSVRVAMDRFDLSFDVRWYLEAIIARISLGWNPLSRPPLNASR